MTSMQTLSGREVPYEEVKARFAREYAAETGINLTHQKLVTSA